MLRVTLEEMGKRENIVKWIKGQRLSWLGHLEGMGEDRMPKKIFTQVLEGMLVLPISLLSSFFVFILQ